MVESGEEIMSSGMSSGMSTPPTGGAFGSRSWQDRSGSASPAGAYYTSDEDVEMEISLPVYRSGGRQLAKPPPLAYKQRFSVPNSQGDVMVREATTMLREASAKVQKAADEACIIC